MVLVGIAVPAAASASDYHFVTAWRHPGNGDGSLSTPIGVAVSGTGSVLHHRLLQSPRHGVHERRHLCRKWGGPGNRIGQFWYPWGSAVSAVSADGTVYVLDTGNDRIQKFDPNGTFITAWGTDGSNNGEFDAPRGIAVDSDDNVYVADSGNNRVRRFAPGGPAVIAVASRSGSPDGYGRRRAVR